MNRASESLPRALLVAAVAMFLAAQLVMSWQLWQRQGNVPPGFDDSYFYITKIELVSRYHSLFPAMEGMSPVQRYAVGMKNATYSLAFGSLAQILRVNASMLYQASFYLGKVVLVGVLLVFFWSLRLPHNLQAASFLLLSGYSGTAATHGFFWVVPDFWLGLFFLLLLAVIFRPPQRTAHGLLLMGGLTIAVFFLHPLSLWVLGVVALSGAILAYIGRDPAVRRRQIQLVACLVTLTVAAYLIQNGVGWYFDLRHAGEDTIRQLLTTAGPITTSSTTTLWQTVGRWLPSAWLMWRGYVRIVLFPPLLILLIAGLVMAWRQYRGIAIAFVVSVICASVLAFHPYGYRTIMFLWPFTWVLIGGGVLRLSGWISRQIGQPVACAASVVLVLLLITSAQFAYSFRFIQSVQAQTSSLAWDTACVEALHTAAGSNTPIIYEDRYAASAFRAAGLFDQPISNPAEFEPSGESSAFSVFSAGQAAREQSIHIAGQLSRNRWRDCGYFAIDQIQLADPETQL